MSGNNIRVGITSLELVLSLDVGIESSLLVLNSLVSILDGGLNFLLFGISLLVSSISSVVSDLSDLVPVLCLLKFNFRVKVVSFLVIVILSGSEPSVVPVDVP